MSEILAIGTYLPTWTKAGRRVRGPDEDAITMAVAAGRAADPTHSAQRVVIVSRNLPLLEGGNGAVLLAGLSLDFDVSITEVLGGAPAVLDQLTEADPQTLVIATDDAAVAAAAAVFTGPSAGGTTLAATGRQTRSLPVVVRTDEGQRLEYGDPRLQRDVGVRATIDRLPGTDNGDVVGVAGVKATSLGGIFAEAAINDTSNSATGIVRVLADAVEAGASGLVLAVEQSVVGTAVLQVGTDPAVVRRDEPAAQELPRATVATGIGIPISLAAYARAFEPKIRWEAAYFPGDDIPVFPPRRRVDDAGVLQSEYTLRPLPRTGKVYTHSTIAIPVPDLPSPYTIALVQLDNTPVRVLLKVTGVPAGETEIDQAGSVVLRRVAMRSGIPDYGYGFWPGRVEAEPVAGSSEGALR